MHISDILDLDTYPLDQPSSAEYQTLVTRCQAELAKGGMFNLTGFMRPDALQSVLDDAIPKLAGEAFTHQRNHNIYFKKNIPDLLADHPALAVQKTINHTLCSDQILGSPLEQLYLFQPFINFLAEVMEMAALYPMDDLLARYNVMGYNEGEALNWHFDRSQFTTTLLLQAPLAGGDFEYRSDLRSDDDPNYEGVAKMLSGQDPDVQLLRLKAGTLNVFRGRNTAHRVTPVQGDKQRVIAVFTYYDTPGRRFTDEENLGFYGRAS